MASVPPAAFFLSRNILATLGRLGKPMWYYFL